MKTLKLLACLTAALTLTLTACRGPEMDPAANLSPEARARTVPIVRPFKLVPMEKPLVVEFDVPVNGPNAVPTLSLDLFVSRSADLSAAEAANIVVDAGLPAQITLQRIDDGITVPVPLIRRAFFGHSGSARVPISMDKMVPGVVPDTVDSTALMAAGSAGENDERRELAFAWAEDISPGTYRLSIQLVDAQASLSKVNAALLVAFAKRSK